MTSQFYVVGGDYSSFNFHKFKHGTEIVLGPYKTRDEAEAIWKEESSLTKSKATYRYIILEEKVSG